MSRRAVIGAGVALAVAAVVVVTASRPSRSRASTPPHTRVASAPPAGAASTGGDRSEEGARAAAVAAATASQDWLYMSDEQMASAVRTGATAEAGPSLAAETVVELGKARDALARSPGQVWWLVRPLATHVERYDRDRATVVVWTVTVLSAAEVALPQADWLRVAVDLAWADGAWRYEAVTDTPGPTPTTGTKDSPWQAVPFDQALDGFERAGTDVVKR